VKLHRLCSLFTTLLLVSLSLLHAADAPKHGVPPRSHPPHTPSSVPVLTISGAAVAKANS
jgi:hypothetical protein